eukprot:364231-Chlamydomonas_euryale.AAC.2
MAQLAALRVAARSGRQLSRLDCRSAVRPGPAVTRARWKKRYAMRGIRRPRVDPATPRPHAWPRRTHASRNDTAADRGRWRGDNSVRGARAAAGSPLPLPNSCAGRKKPRAVFGAREGAWATGGPCMAGDADAAAGPPAAAAVRVSAVRARADWLTGAVRPRACGSAGSCRGGREEGATLGGQLGAKKAKRANRRLPARDRQQ